MIEGWEIKKLADLCKTFADGDWIEKKDQAQSGIRLVQTGNVGNGVFRGKDDNRHYISQETFERLHCTEIFPGDILISRLPEPVGRGCLIPETGEKMITAVDCTIIRLNSGCLPQFLVYYSQSAEYQYSVREVSTGTTRQRISRKNLGEIGIPVPSLAEQQRIVDILDQEFAKIDALKANAEKSLQAANDLFQATLKKELEPKEGWETSSLSSIGKTATGTTPSTSNKENYGSFIPFIKPADVNVDGKGALCYDNDGLSDIGASRGRVFPENSILMVCIGASIGKVGYSLRPVSSNQQINILSPGKEFYWKYIYYCMASGDFQQKVIKEGESAKATLPIINKSKWERLTISSPGITEQERIASRLDDLNNKCQALQDNYQKTLSLCDDLKQSLLRKAFNGEL